MSNYLEFTSLKNIPDQENPFSTLYEYEDGSRFYIEPVFYTQLRGFKERYPNEYHLIIKEMEKITKKNRRVVFTGNFDFPQTVAQNYIFLEITDVTDLLHIYVEDKSRGSDYGD